MTAELFERPFTIDSGVPLSKAISSMQNSGKEYVILEENGKYAGALDETRIRDYYGDPVITKAGRLAYHPLKVKANESTEEIVRKFIEVKAPIAVVLDGKKAKSVVTRSALLNALVESARMRKATCGECCSQLHVIEGKASIAEAKKLMRDSGSGAIAVRIGGNYGILTLHDIVLKVKARLSEKARDRKFYPTELANLEKEEVGGISSTPAETIEATTPTIKALEKLLELRERGRGISYLMVVNEGEPVGFISSWDLMKATLVQPASAVSLVIPSNAVPFRSSVLDIGARFLESIAAKTGGKAESLKIHVKEVGRTREGRKVQYEVSSTIIFKGNTITSNTPPAKHEHFQAWGMQNAVRDSLRELEEMIIKKAGKAKSVRKATSSDLRERRDTEG